MYILTTLNDDSKGCSEEISEEIYNNLPDWIKQFYTHKELLR